MALLETTDRGLYCAAGDFYIDPWRGVDRALITHAHADHARSGSSRYLCAEPGVEILRIRLGKEASIQAVRYGQPITIGGALVSFHPAGHVLGSAQIRVEVDGEVWVVSGDYKLGPDPTCDPLEPILCHTFISESTFGLPLYRWPDPTTELGEIAGWWKENQERGKLSVLYGYSLGKAQRLLHAVPADAGTIWVHRAVADFLPAYEAAGVSFPPWQLLHPAALKEKEKEKSGRGIVIMPPSAEGAGWLNGGIDTACAFASGWMLLRGMRRWRAMDRGFTISDHADWDGLQQVIRATRAERVLITHGYTTTMVRWLREQGKEAAVLGTAFGGDEKEPETEVTAEPG